MIRRLGFVVQLVLSLTIFLAFGSIVVLGQESGLLNVALAPFSIQKSAVDQDDLTLELSTPRLLKKVRILSSDAILRSGASVTELSSIQWNEGNPDIFLLSGVIGKDSSGLLSARGLLASTSAQIAVIRASGNDLPSLVDDLFKKIDESFSQGTIPILSGKWENKKTKTEYLITHWDSNLLVRLLDAPKRAGVGEWSFAKGTAELSKGIVTANLKLMHHNDKFAKESSPITCAEKAGEVEATGRRIVFKDGEEWQRITTSHPKLLDIDLEKAPEFIAELDKKLDDVLKSTSPEHFQGRAIVIGYELACIERHLGYIWSGFAVEKVQSKLGELQFRFENKTMGVIPGAELFAGIPIIGSWVRPLDSKDNLLQLSVRISPNNPDELSYELSRLGEEWPDQRRLQRIYNLSIPLAKDATGKFMPFSLPNRKSNGLTAWGVRQAGQTDNFRTLGVDPRNLELLKQITGEQIVAASKGAPGGRESFQETWKIFKVGKINLDQPQVGQQTIYVEYSDSYQTTNEVNGHAIEVKMPHRASGTLVRSETILGKPLQLSRQKIDPWKTSILSR